MRSPWTVRRVPGQLEPLVVRHWQIEILEAPAGDILKIGEHGGPDEVHEADGKRATMIAAVPMLYEAARGVYREAFAELAKRERQGDRSISFNDLWALLEKHESAIAQALRAAEAPLPPAPPKRLGVDHD